MFFTERLMYKFLTPYMCFAALPLLIHGTLLGFTITNGEDYCFCQYCSV